MGAIESVVSTVCVFGIFRAATGGVSTSSFLVKLVSFGSLPRCLGTAAYDSYLVDSASSHMLVSKIKPCMSKYKQLYRETANGSLNQLSFI